MFYAKDYATGALEYSAFESKKDRDNFVDDGNRRFNAAPAEVEKWARELFDKTPLEAKNSGLL